MSKFLILIIVPLLLVSCGAGPRLIVVDRNPNHTTTYPTVVNKPKKNPVSPPKTKSSSSNSNASLADKVIWTAVSYKGTPYRYGGTTKRGMDCSGLVMVSFANRGIKLPRSSSAMSAKGHKISLRQAKRGDLVFFRTNRRKPRVISHVGLVTQVKNGVVHFIHASTKRGVVINNMSENYYKKTFAFAKRVL